MKVKGLSDLTKAYLESYEYVLNQLDTSENGLDEEESKERLKEYGLNKLAIAGGVASNSTLRTAMKRACEENGIEFYYPSPILCTDNAAMIGAAAYYEYLAGTRHGWDLNAVPNLRLGER